MSRTPAQFQPPDTIRDAVRNAPFKLVFSLWKEFEDEFDMVGRAWLGRHDRYYLLVRLLNRLDVVHPWLYNRCREVEEEPNGFLDLWAREHYKSTIITYAGAIQEILKDPEITIGIFSHTAPIAKKFLGQIKGEFERNETLKTVYPETLYSNPQKDSPNWSIDGGITVRRKSNPKEATIEAHGLVDGQPISRHYKLIIYDDVVTPDSVSTPDQIKKTTTAWELSDNLGAIGGKKWHIGTRYSYADTYEDIMKRGAVVARVYPATDDGKIDGTPVLFDQETWDAKVIAQGEATISCQMLQNPLAGTQRMFNVEDLNTYEVRPEILNVYIMVDPARSKKKNSANTAIVVLGLDYAMNKYLLDGFNHKMDLRERWVRTAQMFHKWKRAPGVQYCYCGYESFGAQADMDYFEEQMKKPDEGGRFSIAELMWPREGEGSKVDRVQRLGPDIRTHKILLPYQTDPKNLTKLQQKMKDSGREYLIAPIIKRKDENGAIYDVSAQFKLQIHFFPFGGKVDLADAASRIYDMEPKAPKYLEALYYEPDMV
jgi:hypothetical protein